MKKLILALAAVASLSTGAFADIIVQWNFNSAPPDSSATTGTLNPSVGSGTASPVGTVTSDFNAANGSSDPLLGDSNNSNWRLLTFPAQGTGNKTSGAEFSISTEGFKNIVLVYDHFNSATANKYWRIQYSPDGGTTWVDKDVFVNTRSAAWNNGTFSADFSAILEANNNPNFKVRIVSEFQSTAVGGSDVYVAVGGGTYATGGALRTDMVTFNGAPASGQVRIVTEPPTNQVVAVGQKVDFVVVAGGETNGVGYQWRKGGDAVSGANGPIYTIASPQFSDSGDYDVLVSNAVNTVTSVVSVLVVRLPENLAWTGEENSFWDSVSSNWFNTTRSERTSYAGGDHVLFDDRGNLAPQVHLSQSVNPSSLTVDAGINYSFTGEAGAGITSTTGVTKSGSGTLTLATDNSYAGPTVINAGALHVGAAGTRGTLGKGAITNSGTLAFDRSDTLTISNPIFSPGDIINLGKTVNLTGTNTYSGNISVPSGVLNLNGNQILNSPNVSVTTLLSGLGGATTFGISGGITSSPSTILTTYGNNIAGDYRARFTTSAGTNVWNGPINLSGASGSVNNSIQSDAIGAELRIEGDISAIDGFTSPGSLAFRGVGSVVMNGNINLPGIVVNKTDAGIWTLASTGNEWTSTALVVGTLRLGADNALPTGLVLSMGQANATAVLDLGGFDQTISFLGDSPTTGFTTIVTNSSAVADSTLTLNNSSGTFSGVIKDGSKTVSLTIANGSFVLRSNNTYTGTTTVNGALSLAGAGGIPNSKTIVFTGGSMLDAASRADGTFTLNAPQTLRTAGALTIGGALVNNGTIAMNVNKTGAAITSDLIQGASSLTYGGMLELAITGDSPAAGDSIKLFESPSYSGAFSAITPATPGSGLTWDTGTLTTDGTLRVTSAAVPTIQQTFLTGTNLVFTGSGGTPSGTFYVLSSTNITLPLNDWERILTNQFDESGLFRVTNGIVNEEAQRFFLLQRP